MEEERSTEIDISLGDLLGILRQCWIIMLAAMIVVGISLYAFLNATHVDEYTAQATIYVGSGNNEGSSGMTTSDFTIADKLVQDCIGVAKHRQTLKRVIDNQNRVMKVSDLEKRITATNRTNTRLIDVTVSAGDKESAMELTDELAAVICDEINRANGNERCTVFYSADLPESISNPVSKMTVLLVAVAAAVLVYVVYLILFLLDDKINGPEDVERHLQLSILGQIPNKQDAGRRRKMYAYDSSSK